MSIDWIGRIDCFVLIDAINSVNCINRIYCIDFIDSGVLNYSALELKYNSN